MAHRISRIPSCPTWSALELAGSQVISLAWGIPAPELLPVEQISACTGTPLLPACLQYGDLLGDRRLRSFLQANLADRGIGVPLEQIAILTGGCLGIEFFTRLLADRHEAILLESPAFSEAIRIFRAYSDHLIAVPVDGHGLIPEALDEAVADLNGRGIRPKLLYTVPHGQNPTGATLARDRRRRILGTAIQRGITILEDDPYYLLHFGNSPLPPLRALDNEGAVIYLDSFSKSLAPGLRIGWAVVPPALLGAFKSLKQSCDFSPNPFAQEAAYRFCSEGHLEPHVQRLRSAYRQRKGLLLQAVRQFLPEATVRVDPEGGFFLWLDLPPDGPSTQELLPRALDAGVSYIPGPTLDPDGASHRSLRLSYSYEQPERFEAGVRRLAGILG